ncbi:MAG: hypothetical protein KDA89_04040 [Planctomycetaceae bacterium]|nr:hypothetical protein [Planctomycetaceae bacterium]
MQPDQMTLDEQLELAAGLISECRGFQKTLNELRHKTAEVADAHKEQLERIRQTVTTSRDEELRRIEERLQSESDTLQFDLKSRAESVSETHQQHIRRLHRELQDGTEELEEKRRTELWVLQSVLDEDVENSPVRRFDREIETFVTHKAVIDERFEQMEAHVEQSRRFLASCHTSNEAVLPPPSVTAKSRDELRDAAAEGVEQVVAETDRLQRMHLPQWIRGFRLWGFSLLGFVVLWIPLIALKADLRAFVNPDIRRPDWQWTAVAATIAGVVVLLCSLIVTMIVQGRLRRAFDAALQHRSNAEHARATWERRSQKQIDQLEKASEDWRTKVRQQREDRQQRINSEIDSRLSQLQSRVTQQIRHSETQITAVSKRLEDERTATSEQMEQQRRHQRTQAEQRFQQDLHQQTQQSESAFQAATEDLRTQSAAILGQWNARTAALRQLRTTAVANAAATRQWPNLSNGTWTLPAKMPQWLSVGDVLTTTPRPPESIAKPAEGSLCVEFPGLLKFPSQTSLLVEHDSAGREAALSFLRRQLLKLITVIPAGRFRLTLIDPVGLGQSFSALMHLTDFDELLIHSRIWTDAGQIRDQLRKVTEHMENIFQTYLRSQFETIEDYNASAGEVAEPYHFVVVAGFPTAFSEESARHLSSVLTSGPRCGVHAMVAWNPTVSVPPSFDADDLINHCVRFRVTDQQIQPVRKLPPEILFEAYPEPAADEYVALVRHVGEQSKHARRVEVSFSRIAPQTDDIWTHSTADGIDLPIGRAGAARLQYMRLGRGTSQHVLVAGKTGSGKSTFLHILITNLSLHYSPDEIQFYLIDFKKGVEFRTYAAHHLPHARVVAIESDREFGLSVLERLDEILQERGELFRERGIQDVPSFREQFPEEPMPRLLLLIDEFQEFFVAEDRVSSRASLLLDRLVRQGRAFGVHVLLGSQTLGGAYSLARSTMGQIAVRIALQCSEADAHLILSEDNTAARLLAQPGEEI